jgi:hypothetical protein
MVYISHRLAECRLTKPPYRFRIILEDSPAISVHCSKRVTSNG